MTKRKDKLQSTPTPSKDERWVVTYTEKGDPHYWEPYELYLARKFMSKIANVQFMAQCFWGKKITDKQRIWEIAQEMYEEYKDELPISYLEYYKP